MLCICLGNVLIWRNYFGKKNGRKTKGSAHLLFSSSPSKQSVWSRYFWLHVHSACSVGWNDRKFLGRIVFSLTQTNQQYFFTNQPSQTNRLTSFNPFCTWSSPATSTCMMCGNIPPCLHACKKQWSYPFSTYAKLRFQLNIFKRTLSYNAKGKSYECRWKSIEWSITKA